MANEEEQTRRDRLQQHLDEPYVPIFGGKVTPDIRCASALDYIAYQLFQIRAALETIANDRRS